MKFTILILLLATLAHAAPADVLGKVGDIEITSTDVREMIAGLDAEQQAALAKDPEALGQYVRALLVQRLVLKQALDKKWDQEPAVISKLVRAREAALTESFLQNASVSNASYPSAEELSAAYEVAKSKLIIPRSYKLAQIYIAKDKAKMESISKQIKAKGADFATSAAKGGEIGWLTEDQIQPEIREKILTLAPGKVGEPVSLQDGWHLIKVLEIREPRTPALDEIRDNLVTQLRKDRSRSMRQEYLATLLKDHPLAINEIELTKLVEKP